MADIRHLPFADNEVDEIQGIHCFEHLHRMDAPNALKEWKRVLKPGGELVLEMPCLDSIIQMVKDGELDYRMTLFGLYGDPREPGDFMTHRWGWSKKELIQELEITGFKQISIETPIFHYPQRDMRSIAFKGE